MTIIELKKEREAKHTALFKDCALFWAFSNEQFAEGKAKHPIEEGEKYVSIGAGGYMPKSNVGKFNSGMKEIQRWFNQATKDEKTRKALIRYELNNHEATYTGEIEDTLNALGEGYTPEEVQKELNQLYQLEYD